MIALRVLVTYEGETFVKSCDNYADARSEAGNYRRTLVALGKFPEFDVFLRRVDRFGAVGLFVMRAVQSIELDTHEAGTRPARSPMGLVLDQAGYPGACHITTTRGCWYECEVCRCAARMRVRGNVQD